jgi:small subunit ribosomal protein S20
MRQSRKRRDRNRRNTSQVKSQIRKLRTLVAQGDAKAAQAALDGTISEIDRAAKKGVVHRNAAARYKSRLSKKISALAGA